jgi:branched-chain amino acid transport system substrate-binding protein
MMRQNVSRFVPVVSFGVAPAVAKYFVLFASVAVLGSCSATIPVKREPVKAPPVADQDMRAAESALKAGDPKKAAVRLKKIATQYPESELAGRSHFMMGQLNLNAQKYQDALNDFKAVLSAPVASPYEIDSRIRAAYVSLKLSQPAEAEKYIDNDGYFTNMKPEQSMELARMRYETFLALKKHTLALSNAVFLAQNHPRPNDRERYKGLAQEILETRLTDEELAQVADNKDLGFMLAPAKYRYALRLAEQNNYSKARGYLVEVAELAPRTELADRATSLVAQIDARNRVDERTIGVVLPLSGKQAGIGYKALRGIQLGLGVYGAKTPSGFKLAVIDSEGNPDTARRAVERLVQEDNVVAIVGGLLSKTVSSEATKAQELGVPAIMLSQKTGVTQTGNFIFRNALTSEMQVEYLVDVAMNKMGYKNFAMLFPNDAYGTEFANLFWDIVKARGGEIRGAQPYDPKETDFRGHVQRLTGLFYLEDRSDEYRLRTKAWTEKNPKRGARQSAPAIEDLLPPIVDFDAIFIPDSARAVGQIAPMLAYNNISGVRLLGTNLWNTPGLIQRGQKFVENSIFPDSFLVDDPAFKNSEFASAFRTTFEEEPGLTEIQAYDSALILRQLIASGERTRMALRDRMTSLQNFPGALGRLSVNAEREFRRPLTALTIRDGKFMDLDAAGAVKK